MVNYCCSRDNELHTLSDTCLSGALKEGMIRNRLVYYVMSHNGLRQLKKISNYGTEAMQQPSFYKKGWKRES